MGVTDRTIINNQIEHGLRIYPTTTPNEYFLPASRLVLQNNCPLFNPRQCALNNVEYRVSVVPVATPDNPFSIWPLESHQPIAEPREREKAIETDDEEEEIVCLEEMLDKIEKEVETDDEESLIQTKKAPEEEIDRYEESLIQTKKARKEEIDRLFMQEEERAQSTAERKEKPLITQGMSETEEEEVTITDVASPSKIIHKADRKVISKKRNLRRKWNCPVCLKKMKRHARELHICSRKFK